MTNAELAQRIDHTLLKPEAAPDDVARLTREALEHNFASVCVNGRFAAQVRADLDAARASAPHNVLCCAVAAFPLGATTPMAMAAEATLLAKNGAQEIDVVAWLPHLLARNADGLRDDLLHTTRALRAVSPNIAVKVILETAALRAAANSDADFERMIETGCAAARQSGCAFVKTSTGFHPSGGAAVDAVRLMRKHAGADLRVKASGGVRTRDDALRMLDAGADRLGTSSGVAILSATPYPT